MTEIALTAWILFCLVDCAFYLMAVNRAGSMIARYGVKVAFIPGGGMWCAWKHCRAEVMK